MYTKSDNVLGTCHLKTRHTYYSTAAKLTGLDFLIPRCDENFCLGGCEVGRLILSAF
jgi:hypothetical protein